MASLHGWPLKAKFRNKQPQAIAVHRIPYLPRSDWLADPRGDRVGPPGQKDNRNGDGHFAPIAPTRLGFSIVHPGCSKPIPGTIQTRENPKQHRNESNAPNLEQSDGWQPGDGPPKYRYSKQGFCSARLPKPNPPPLLRIGQIVRGQRCFLRSKKPSRSR